MIDNLLSTQRTFLASFKPQRTNLYVVEYPGEFEDARERKVSLSTGLVSQLVSPDSSFGTTISTVQSNPLSLVNIPPELNMMTERVVLPGWQVETFQTNQLSYYQELAKGSGFKRATITFRCNDDLGEYKTMKDWYDQVIDPVTRRAGFWSDYAEGKNITVTTMNSFLEPKVEIALLDVFPVDISPLEFTYEETDGLLKFDITFSVRDVQIDKTEQLSSLAQGALNRFF